jgi:hypothetical protein
MAFSGRINTSDIWCKLFIKFIRTELAYTVTSPLICIRRFYAILGLDLQHECSIPCKFRVTIGLLTLSCAKTAGTKFKMNSPCRVSFPLSVLIQPVSGDICKARPMIPRGTLLCCSTSEDKSALRRSQWPCCRHEMPSPAWTGIVGSNPTRSMDALHTFFCVFVFLCR